MAGVSCSSRLGWGVQLNKALVLHRFLHGSSLHHPVSERDQLGRRLKPVFLRPEEHDEQVAIGDAPIGAGQKVALHHLEAIAHSLQDRLTGFRFLFVASA